MKWTFCIGEWKDIEQVHCISQSQTPRRKCVCNKNHYCNKREGTVATPPAPSPTSILMNLKGLYSVYTDTLLWIWNAWSLKFIGWNITSQSDSEDGALGMWLDLEGGGSLGMGFHALIKEQTQEEYQLLLPWDIQSVTRKSPLLWPYTGSLILAFQLPELLDTSSWWS